MPLETRREKKERTKNPFPLDARVRQRKNVIFDRLDLLLLLMLTVNERGKTFMLFMSNSTIYVRNLIYMFIYLFLDGCYRSSCCVYVNRACVCVVLGPFLFCCASKLNEL